MGETGAGVFISFGSTGTVIGNAGQIISANAWGIDFDNSATDPAYFVRNSGTVTGGTGAVRGHDGGGDTVTNTGTMFGDVQLRDGNDLYSAAGDGLVVGLVDGGTGNDTLVGGDLADSIEGGGDDDTLVGRAGDDTLSGGDGLDRMVGGDGNDSMSGGAGNDTMTGNAGSDEIAGDGGDDLLVGQAGADYLDGGADDDILDGGAGDDTLEGGAGNDILRGRAGEDELVGGLGRDFLTGGQDADVFVFRGIAETVVGAMRDQILDFEQGVDLITVAGLSPSVFEFKGTAAFDPVGLNPELRLIETGTGSTIVQFDVNGDAVVDAELRVAGVTGLTAEDFVL